MATKVSNSFVRPLFSSRFIAERLAGREGAAGRAPLASQESWQDTHQPRTDDPLPFQGHHAQQRRVQQLVHGI